MNIMKYVDHLIKEGVGRELLILSGVLLLLAVLFLICLVCFLRAGRKVRRIERAK